MLRQPMLSGKAENGKIETLLPLIRYPKLASPKMDGIRAFNQDGKLLSRTLKSIPNHHTRDLFGRPEFAGLDGELIVGRPFDFNVMQQTTSGVSTRAFHPEVCWYVFDDFSSGLAMPFSQRLKNAQQRVAASANASIKFVPHVLVRNQAEMIAYEAKCLDRGYEGIMLRDPNGPYKVGRSTISENWLLAIKRFEDFEARIVSVHEKMHNGNDAMVDERGYTKRTGHKANKCGLGTLGGFTCVKTNGVEFDVGIGKGLDDETRARLWAIRNRLPGMLAKCSSLPVGVKESPRHPKILNAQFLGIRPEYDA